MAVLSHQDAEWADGPKLMDWLDGCSADLAVFQGTQLRMIQRWRKGSQANFYALDKILIAVGLHPSMLPNSVWREYDNGRRLELDERDAA